MIQDKILQIQDDATKKDAHYKILNSADTQKTAMTSALVKLDNGND